MNRQYARYANRRSGKRIFAWALVLLWMGLIFYLSHQPIGESAQLSRRVTGVVIDIVDTVAPDAHWTPAQVNHFVRKSSHFLAYLVLGLLVRNALAEDEQARYARREGWKTFLLALVICVLYAVSDEYHQSFVPGRGAQVADVVLDGFGAFTGLIMYEFGRWLRAERLARRRGKHVRWGP